MQGRAAMAVLTRYVASLVLTILAPLQWARLWMVAKKHRSMDPRAQMKMAAGVVIGLALAGFSTSLVLDFEADATHGMYETLSGRLSISLGNEAYKGFVANEQAAASLVATANSKIAEAQQANDTEAEELWRANREKFVADRISANENASALVANAGLWQRVNASLLLHHDDAAAKTAIAQRSDEVVDFGGTLQEKSDLAFDRKDEALADMQSMLAWFIYPGLIGVLWAPVAFAAGHVLKKSFIPSDTVGFKPYPGGAAGLFLLFGAFGVPALFFAAWVMQDFVDRTEAGQISL